ncbi:MAG: hypothetical protein HY909_18915 [Deltaproteobacteria bacterium]|nr:hypothetical protein [Deltaproteobacteria bacterium]
MAQPGKAPPCDHDHDHDCQTCGAPPRAGLAACPFCKAGYPGAEAGALCPGCRCLNEAGRTVCAQCQDSLTRTCVFCQALGRLDQAQCPRCHEVFEGAEDRKRLRDAQRAQVPTHGTPRADPSGAGVFNALNDILKR